MFHWADLAFYFLVGLVGGLYLFRARKNRLTTDAVHVPVQVNAHSDEVLVNNNNDEPIGCCGGQKKTAIQNNNDEDFGCCGGSNQDTGCCQSNSTSRSVSPFHPDNTLSSTSSPFAQLPIKIIYGTQTGTAKLFAKQLSDLCISSGFTEPIILNINDYDTEDLYSEKSPILFILSTYSEGTPTADAEWFFKWLEDTRYDFRVSKTCFGNLPFAVFGLGDSVYAPEYFCTVAKMVDKYLFELAGKRLASVGLGDKNDGMVFIHLFI